MHVKSEHLYKILLKPNDFAQYLYTRDPVVSCGLTWDDEFHPLGQYIASQMYDIAASRGSVYVSDGVTSFHEWNAPHSTISAINPPWVRIFNRCLRHLSGGEPDREIWPGTALQELSAALDCKFPESPFAGAEVYWPCYTEGEDDPADRPYGIANELDGWQFINASSTCFEELRFVVLNFQRGLLRRGITFNVPEYFPLHFGFENHKGQTVREVKTTRAFADRVSKYLITFEHGQKLAIPNQAEISNLKTATSNIPF